VRSDEATAGNHRQLPQFVVAARLSQATRPFAVHRAVRSAAAAIAATSSEKSAAVPCGRYARDKASAITKRDPGQ